VRELKAQGMRPVDIAKALKIGRASVYRVLGQRADNEATREHGVAQKDRALASVASLSDPRGLAADPYGLDDARAGRDLCHSVMRSSGAAVWTRALGSAPPRNVGPSAAGI
jgi:hypothetical protein